MNIIELAKEAGLPCQHPDWIEVYERFAALVRAEALKEQYFCQRCGKRVGDTNGVLGGIHTCTPPEDVRGKK